MGIVLYNRNEIPRINRLTVITLGRRLVGAPMEIRPRREGGVVLGECNVCEKRKKGGCHPIYYSIANRL